MRKGPQARAAGPGDLGQLARLAAQAVSEQRGSRGGPVWSVREARPPPFNESITAALADERGRVWLGTFDGAPLGYAVAHMEELRDGTLLGIIDDIYVEADARGVGVGEALAEAIVSWCEAEGCRGIDAWALPGNRETKNFFESFGFTARGIVVHRELGSGS